ncbi:MULTISPECIES: glycoside hydrolase family 88 protein [Cupriavidus]
MRFGLAHPDERDSWMRAPFLCAVLEQGDAAAVAVVDGWLRRAVATQRASGNLAYADTVQGLGSGHIRSFTPLATLSAALGYPLLQRYRQCGDAALLAAARRQVEALRACPRTAAGGFWARAEGPELWIDFTYLVCPFLALYGDITGDAAACDEAFRQYEIHVDHLLDARAGLARHAWCERPDHFPQSTFWSRGNGWLLCASVALLELAPGHARAPYVAGVLQRVLGAMAAHQEPSGYFCHVLDDPRSNLEASGTLMFAYAAARAVALGAAAPLLLGPARRAFEAVVGAVEPSGKVPGVAVPPGGPGVPFDWAPFGQGFFLLAAQALQAAPAEVAA